LYYNGNIIIRQTLPTNKIPSHRNSGDITTGDSIYTCSIQESDNFSDTDWTDIRVVAIDQNAQREFKRINTNYTDTKPSLIINDDFNQDIGNWDGNWILESGGYKSEGVATANTFNTTPLPKALTIDLDFIRSATASIGHELNFYFHLSGFTSDPKYTDPRIPTGYLLQYRDFWGQDGLTLYRQSSTWGGWKQLGNLAEVSIDGNMHHLKISDDGAGHIQVYFDNSNTPVIDVQDAAYVGVDDSYIALRSFGNAKGLVDNVIVIGN
jgi:hypothetical protein